jgi:hypothetical protein
MALRLFRLMMCSIYPHFPKEEEPEMAYNLFISHSWSYGGAYQMLKKKLDAASNFSYKNYSVPGDDYSYNAPDKAKLYEEIKGQIANAQVVLILSGVHARYSKWIDMEIKIAKTEFSLPKLIIAIQPWGAEKISELVKDSADKIVGWNKCSIVTAIRELAK